MTSTKKNIAALEMQTELGHKFYEPIWEMMHKIRVMCHFRATVHLTDIWSKNRTIEHQNPDKNCNYAER